MFRNVTAMHSLCLRDSFLGIYPSVIISGEIVFRGRDPFSISRKISGGNAIERCLGSFDAPGFDPKFISLLADVIINRFRDPLHGLGYEPCKIRISTINSDFTYYYPLDFLLSIKSCVKTLSELYLKLDNDWYSYAARLYCQMVTEHRLYLTKQEKCTRVMRKYMAWVFLPIFEAMLSNMLFITKSRDSTRHVYTFSIEGLFDYYVHTTRMKCNSLGNHLGYISAVLTNAFVRHDNVAEYTFSIPTQVGGIRGDFARFVDDCRSSNYGVIFEQLIQCDDAENLLCHLPSDLLLKISSYLVSPSDFEVLKLSL